jgi:hypothetical protein
MCNLLLYFLPHGIRNNLYVIIRQVLLRLISGTIDCLPVYTVLKYFNA